MTEDWSLVRSPSRALRRLSLGHRQNITVTEEETPDHTSVSQARSRLLRERREDLEGGGK